MNTHSILCGLGVGVVLTGCISRSPSPKKESALPASGIEIALTETERTKLLAKADKWGVPQPKPGSSLVKIPVFRSEKRDFYALGFREETGSQRALVGFDYWDTARHLGVQEVLHPDKLSLDDISPTSPFFGVHDLNFGLATGLQLVRAGQTEIGIKLIEKALQEQSGHHASPLWSPGGEPPLVMLARTCLADAMNKITTETPDFKSIKRRIEIILADQPILKNKTTAWVLEDLEENVRHKPPIPGSIEEIIDAYLMSGRIEGALAFSAEGPSKAETDLILTGFKAVPALLKQRHSKRLTNHVMQGFNNFPSYPMNAGQVINAYLQRLANDDMGSNWLARQKGFTSENETVQAWWKMSSKMGERSYVEAHTILLDKEGRASLSMELLQIASNRYPELLPGFYQQILETSRVSWPVAQVLHASEAIPRQKKIELFMAGVATNSEAHRNTALQLLTELQKNLGEKELFRLIEQSPGTTRDEYWTDQNADLGRLVSDSTNDQIWQAYRALIKRGDLGMQMELIDNLNPPRDAPAHIIAEFHAIYDKFQNDSRVRNENRSEKFSGPGAGFPYEKLAMRDYVHLHWAKWLDLKSPRPAEGASKAKWRNYRKIVQKAIREARDTDRP